MIPSRGHTSYDVRTATCCGDTGPRRTTRCSSATTTRFGTSKARPRRGPAATARSGARSGRGRVSDVTDIVAFIRARLDEDERIARASGHLDGHSWTDSPVRSGFGVVAGCDGGLCENDTADAHLMHLA